MDDLALLPFGIPAIGGLLLLLFVRNPRCPEDAPRAHRALPATAVALLVAAIAAAVVAWMQNPGGVHETFFGQMVTFDTFSIFLTVTVLVCGVATVAALQPYAAQIRMDHGELYALILFAVAGMVVLTTGTDLVVLFLGLEIMSLAVYGLVGLRRQDLLANESALKYVLLGAFSSSIFLFGIAFCYGAAGSTNLYRIAEQSQLAGSAHGYFWIGLMLLVAGLAFKVASFPFQMWAPDVYQGAAAPITGFMATAVKAASFALFMRILLGGFAAWGASITPVLWWLAVLTMFVGNLSALVQTNLKRMLAYSSIAHTGYLLIGLTAAMAGNRAGATAMLYYLAAYALTNLGAFACVAYLSGPDESRVTLESWAGIGRRHPWIAVAMGLCMLSLIGFPPTAGFFGKYLLFTTAIAAGQAPLAMIGIFNSILSVWYYLRVIVVMTMREPSAASATVPGSEVVPAAAPAPQARRHGAALVALYAAIALVWAGIGPLTLLAVLPGAQPLASWASAAMGSLF